MAVVTNKDRYGNELTADQMIRKFKKKVADQGILEDLRKHEYYRSKATKRREKHKAAIKRLRKLEREANIY